MALVVVVVFVVIVVVVVVVRQQLQLSQLSALRHMSLFLRMYFHVRLGCPDDDSADSSPQATVKQP